MSNQPPTALLHLAIEPRTKADREKLNVGLLKLMADDLTFRARTDEQTGQVVVWGISEPQLEIIVDRLRREFSVEARVGRLQVAYKETLTRPAAGEMKYAKQTGGRGQYAHAKIHLFPGGPGTGYVFENNIVTGTIPEEFIMVVEKTDRADQAGVFQRGARPRSARCGPGRCNARRLSQAALGEGDARP